MLYRRTFLSCEDTYKQIAELNQYLCFFGFAPPLFPRIWKTEFRYIYRYIKMNHQHMTEKKRPSKYFVVLTFLQQTFVWNWSLKYLYQYSSVSTTTSETSLIQHGHVIASFIPYATFFKFSCMVHTQLNMANQAPPKPVVHRGIVKQVISYLICLYPVLCLLL